VYGRAFISSERPEISRAAPTAAKLLGLAVSRIARALLWPGDTSMKAYWAPSTLIEGRRAGSSRFGVELGLLRVADLDLGHDLRDRAGWGMHDAVQQ
jgi:hypothetical protein